jgi:hypothetical protein
MIPPIHCWNGVGKKRWRIERLYAIIMIGLRKEVRKLPL